MLSFDTARGARYNIRMNMQKLLSPMRRAIEDYNMISDGDSVAVGLSGGKDSTALLGALAAFRRFSPARFDLIAVTVDMGAGADYTPMKEYCASLGVRCVIERTQLYEIIFEVRKEKNPCSLCAKMRRGALASVVRREGCNKLALGHNADDVAETLLMSLFYEGRLSTFKPVSHMSRSGVTVIRPLVYADEKDIAALCADTNIPIVNNPCPVNRRTNREYMKELIRRVDKDSGYIADRNLKRALFNPSRNSLWDDPADEG